jgi:integrase
MSKSTAKTAQKTPRYQLNKNKYLLDPEFERLHKILDTYKDEDSRNCTLLWTLLYTGGRAQEVLNLQKSDLNRHEETVLITGLKGSNDREIPVPSWLFRRLAKMADEIPEDIPHLFDITYNRLRQIWDHYRPINKKLHSLRHTFAIRLYKKTRDLRLVQVALGHRNIMNTMVYADYVYSHQELRRLIL